MAEVVVGESLWHFVATNMDNEKRHHGYNTMLQLNEITAMLFIAG